MQHKLTLVEHINRNSLFFTLNYNIYLFAYSGFVKFLGPYYMVIITRRRKIGTICGHEIYSVAKSEMIAIPSVIVWPNVAYSRDENRSFIFSTCKYCVLPVVIPSVVLNIINNASLLPSVHFIALLFIYLIVGCFLSTYLISFWLLCCVEALLVLMYPLSPLSVLFCIDLHNVIPVFFICSCSSRTWTIPFYDFVWLYNNTVIFCSLCAFSSISPLCINLFVQKQRTSNSYSQYT